MSQPTETIPASASSIARKFPRPTARQWALHAALLVITAITTTISGIVFSLSSAEALSAVPAETGGVGGSLLSFPWYYLSAVVELVRFALAHPHVLPDG